AALERKRLERLAKLAASQPKDEADVTYEAYFRFAIAAGLYRDAEPTAELDMKGAKAAPQVTALATLVNIVAEANRGAYQESLDSIVAAIKARAKAQEGVALPLESRLALAEAYYQRLVQGDQFEIARKALALIRDNTDSPAMKDYAARRLRQIDLVGKP